MSSEGCFFSRSPKLLTSSADCRDRRIPWKDLKSGVPSRTLTGNLTFRTRPLCDLSYGDERIKPLAGLFHRLTPGTSKVNEGRKG